MISSDAFIIPEFQKLKEIQRATKSKYEVRICTSSNADLACASLNYLKFPDKVFIYEREVDDQNPWNNIIESFEYFNKCNKNLVTERRCDGN